MRSHAASTVVRAPRQNRVALRSVCGQLGVKMRSALNLDYPRWYEMFDNKPLVDALLDRLRHQCITIRIDGPSLREPAPETSPTPAPAASPSPPAQRTKRPPHKPT